tara:strand:+ start:538 stop:1398 length:861 start_codon:yes stop_codon:yes gene_type:complete
MELSITIYILDDSTDNKTELYCKNLCQKEFPIKYKKNQPSLGHDKNLIAALKSSNSDYVWLLGDSIVINDYSIKSVYKLCKEARYSIIAMNAEGRDLDLKSGVYDNNEFILKNLGWHLTLTGATVYSRDVIDKMDNFHLERFRNFPQFSLIFHFLADKSKFYWINRKILASHPSKKSYWLNDVFSVFLMDWWHVIISLPDTYSSDVKFDAWKNHSLKTNLFTIKTLLNMRYTGVYNYSEYLTYRNYLFSHSRLNPIILFLLSIFPVIFLSTGFTVSEYFRELLQKK